MTNPVLYPIGVGTEARRVAVLAEHRSPPGIFWLGGFKSDMRGTKAEALAEWAEKAGRDCIRFDYSGHGESEGSFEDGTISRWLEESVAVFKQFCRGPQIVVGSSMGGWLALLLARALQESEAASAGIKALVLIAPAPDFTQKLLWERFPDKIKREVQTKGRFERMSEYADEPFVYTLGLIEDGRKHLVLDKMIEPNCPVRILQGAKDDDVPWSHAMALVSRIARDDVVFTLVKDGDHRLSRPEDIERLIEAVAEFV